MAFDAAACRVQSYRNERGRAIGTVLRRTFRTDPSLSEDCRCVAR